jgi:hypothetical protein
VIWHKSHKREQIKNSACPIWSRGLPAKLAAVAARMCGPIGNRLKNMPDKADVAGARLLADYFWLADEMVSTGPNRQPRRRYPSSILAISMAATIIARITTIQFWNVKPRSVNCCTSQSSTLFSPTYYLMSAGPRQPCV